MIKCLAVVTFAFPMNKERKTQSDTKTYTFHVEHLSGHQFDWSHGVRCCCCCTNANRVRHFILTLKMTKRLSEKPYEFRTDWDVFLFGRLWNRDQILWIIKTGELWKGAIQSDSTQQYRWQLKFRVLDNVRTKRNNCPRMTERKTMWQFNQSACRKRAYIKSLKWYPFELDSHMRAPTRSI